MTRRDFLPLIAGTLSASRPSFSQTADDRATRPNVVLITADHLRWNHLACNGNPSIRTPNLDRLAKAGVSFTSCSTVGVACAPNRASLLTGRYPNAHGIIANGIPMPEAEVTLTHVLRESGYYTGQMGKLHFQPHSGRNHREPHPAYGFHQMRLSDEPGCYDDAYGLWLDAQGPEVRKAARVVLPQERTQFDYYTFAGDERTTHAHWVASETLRFIDENRSRSFFVHAGFYAPHPPLNPPASMLRLYDGVTLPARIGRAGESASVPPNVQKAMARGADRSESDWTAYRKHFYAMVSEFDRQVGRILDGIEAANLQATTLVVLTSDHGDYLGDHNLNGKSDLPYDGALRIPLLFRGPGVPNEVQSNALCEMVDVMPTILDLLGMKLPKGNQGTSLKKAMRGEPAKPVTLMQGVQNQTVRSEKAKYCLWRSGEELLFDLRKDPTELYNLAQDPTARTLKEEMRFAMLKRSLDIRDPLPEKIAPY